MDIFKNVQNRKVRKSLKKEFLKHVCDHNGLKIAKKHKKSVTIKINYFLQKIT
jgi:hypothetical protein